MLQDWLRLYYTPHIGPKRFKNLLDYFSSAHNVIVASDNEWKQSGIPSNVLKNRYNSDLNLKIESALNWAEHNDHHIITLEDPLYPELLKYIPDPPPLLFLRGNPHILNQPQIAIVGSRRPTTEGKDNSYQFARHLGTAGFTITSGLALGIDERAHSGALSAKATTIAVLGTGLEQVYPKQHTSLCEEIVSAEGALLSELPLHTPPKAINFPRRNRIIAGLALGTLVVEAARKSGSLITARLSAEFNREVFAIPSSIHSPQSKGTHYLIQHGAKLVESTHDIREELKGWLPSDTLTAKFSENNNSEKQLNEKTPTNQALFETVVQRVITPNDPQQQTIFLALDKPKTIDELVNELGIETSLLSNDLLMLEIEGFIKNIGAGRYLQL